MAAHETDAFWREVVDSLTDAIIVVSGGLEVITANPAAETLLDASPIRRSLLDRLFTHNQWLASMIGKCLASGQSLNYPETGLRLAQREALVRAEVSPLINPR